MKIEDEIKQKKFIDDWHKASINLIFTSNWLKEHHQRFFKPFDITMQQFNVLRILRGQYPNPLSTCDIRERLLDKMSDTPRIVNRLIKSGWVVKFTNSSDKRLIDVIITEKGLQLLNEIDAKMGELHNTMKTLTQEEAAQLSSLLDKLRG